MRCRLRRKYNEVQPPASVAEENIDKINIPNSPSIEEVPAVTVLLECISMTDEWYEENKKLIGQVLISGMHHTTMGTRAASNRLVVADMLIRVLKAGQSKGEISADVSAEDTATMLVGLFFSITFDWMHDKGAWSLIDGEDQEMCDFLLN